MHRVMIKWKGRWKNRWKKRRGRRRRKIRRRRNMGKGRRRSKV